jgi:endogenous inhibitor of DNA gyrase (YacG/DUF329 family)
MFIVDPDGRARAADGLRSNPCPSCGERMVLSNVPYCPACASRRVRAILDEMAASGEASPNVFRAHWGVAPPVRRVKGEGA